MKDSEKLEVLEDKDVVEVVSTEEKKPEEVLVKEKSEEVVLPKKKETPIWDYFKTMKMSLFNLPEELVSNHIKFITETNGSLLVSFKLPALISALESSFKGFTFEVVDKNKIEIKRSN